MSEPQAPRPFPYGKEFQMSTLRLMMMDEGFCYKCCEYLQEGYFTGELKWFFRKSKDYFTEFSKPPLPDYFVTEILKHKEREAYEKLRLEIDKAKPDPEYLKHEITGFIRANIFIAGYKEAQPLYNSGRMENAYECVNRRMQELIKVDFVRDRVSTFGDHEKVLEEARIQKEQAIPTGIMPIDDAMHGGMMPQTLTVFLGGSNCGKSLLGATLAWHAVMIKQKRVFVTIHEDEKGPTKLRYLSRFSGVPMEKLYLPKSAMNTVDREAVEQADKMLEQFVKFQFMYGADNTIESVVKAVKTMKREWDFDLYYCDYGQCLTSDRFKSMDNTYRIQGYVYEQIKQLCLELEIAGAGGAQVNRDGMKANNTGGGWLRMTDVGDSIEICRKASNVITMNRSSQHARTNRIVYLLDKVRNGVCPKAVLCCSDYSRCATHLSEYENPQQEVPIDGGPNNVAHQA